MLLEIDFKTNPSLYNYTVCVQLLSDNNYPLSNVKRFSLSASK